MLTHNEEFKEELVGKPFEYLSIEEMEEIQGGGVWGDIAQSSGACLATVTASSGWCSAGVVVGTIIYSVMKCG